jgi:ethanolamine utilization microcompartment shell protein EutS
MKRKNSTTLPPEHQTRVRTIMEAHGIAQAARFLGISVHAMERAAGGLTIQPGTAALLSQQIAARDAEGKQP